MIATNAFADFIWDPMTIGYSNIFSLEEEIKVAYGTMTGNPLTGKDFTDKAKTSMNNFAFMPLVAGFGYMPKDKGFYFMWENLLGIGKPRIKFQELDKKFFNDENLRNFHLIIQLHLFLVMLFHLYKTCIYLLVQDLLLGFLQELKK